MNEYGIEPADEVAMIQALTGPNAREYSGAGRYHPHDFSLQRELDTIVREVKLGADA